MSKLRYAEFSINLNPANPPAGFSGWDASANSWEPLKRTEMPISSPLVEGDKIGLVYAHKTGKVYFNHNGVWIGDAPPYEVWNPRFSWRERIAKRLRDFLIWMGWKKRPTVWAGYDEAEL